LKAGDASLGSEESGREAFSGIMQRQPVKAAGRWAGGAILRQQLPSGLMAVSIGGQPSQHNRTRACKKENK